MDEIAKRCADLVAVGFIASDGRGREGHIGLPNHTGKVQFRNALIRSLPSYYSQGTRGPSRTTASAGADDAGQSCGRGDA